MAKNTMYLYGKNPVIERLQTNPKSIRKILLRDDFQDLVVLDLIKTTSVKVERVPRKDFMRKKHADRVQGVIAIVDKFKYVSLDYLLRQKESLTLVFLDSLNDPQNLGVMIRSLACLGGFAVIIPEKGSCHITDTVLHVANGGENYVPVCMVHDLLEALNEVKKAGFWCLAAVTDGVKQIAETSIQFPVCIVIGSESKGISHQLLETSDAQITLPMSGAQLSFNVAVATSLIAYEIFKRSRDEREE